MRYEKIRGKSVSECMMKLRGKYGNSVIILSTREVRQGGLLGSALLSKKMYEIDYMIEEKAGVASSGNRSAGNTGRIVQPMQFRKIFREGATGPLSRATEAILSDSQRVASSGAEEVKAASSSSAVATAAQFPRQGRAGSVAPRRERTTAAAERYAGQGRSAGQKTGTEPTSSTRSGGIRIKTGEKGTPAELEALLREEDDPVATGAQGGEGANPFAEEPEMESRIRSLNSENPDDESGSRYFHKIRNRLLGAQLSRDFTEGFLRGLDHSLSREEKREYQKVEEKTLERLARAIRTTPDISPPRGECRAVMLIGPTGSGKTTSLAKLAARYFIYQSREVSIYSLDHYRLAATEQLKTYAGVMGIPCQAPVNPDQFREMIRRDGAELMLIDGPGIGHKDYARIAELKKYVDACEVYIEKHLVLAANTSPALIEKILLAYDTLGFDKIILTKLDEADFIGAFIEHADKFNRPFSFLMNGVEVPGDIVDPQPMDMAKMILRDELPIKNS